MGFSERVAVAAVTRIRIPITFVATEAAGIDEGIVGPPRAAALSTAEYEKVVGSLLVEASHEQATRGKAVLIADMLPFINRYRDKPLIYNVGWKTTIYVLVALVIHYLEHLLEFWRKTGSLRIANQKLLAEMVWHHFWATQIILAMLIFAYCTVHELGRAFGAERMREIFFGSRAATPPLH